MPSLLDKLIIIDVESTCWRGTPPRNQYSEIIEIGLTLLNLKTLEAELTESILVKPFKSVVSPFCTQLTTLTQEQVDGGIPLYDACQSLRKDYKSDKRIWASWGDYDRKQFEKNCRMYNIRYPFGPRHLNLKADFAIHRGLKQEVGMDKALGIIGEKLEGTHHRGGDDAKNIAKIAVHMLSSYRREAGV